MSEQVYPESWVPLGRLLLDHWEGRRPAEGVVVWEDGEQTRLKAELFFRPFDDFAEVEKVALDLCRGRVLDIGAGTGGHSLELQERGFTVNALDISPDAAEIMRRRGVTAAQAGDVFELADRPGLEETWDTLLLLMNGIGLVGDLDGLDRFLVKAHGLLSPGGQIILDSADLRKSEHIAELARQVRRVAAGAYRGETRQQIEYRGQRGAPFGWLYVDIDTLGRYAEHHGWASQIAFEDSDGAFVARLLRAL